MTRLNVATPVVLGMIEAGHRTGYAIAQAVARSTAHFWPAGQNAIYPELRRLVGEGLLTTTTEDSGARRRDRHELTAAGAAVLDGWRSDVDDLRIEHRDEGLLKLHFGDTLTVGQASALLEAAVAHRREQLERLQEVRPDPTEDRPAAYVSWRTGEAALRHTTEWHLALLDLLRPHPEDARAMPILAAALAENGPRT